MTFRCTQCGAPARVILSRSSEAGAIRRRHRCTADKDHTFSTIQFVVPTGKRFTADELKHLNPKDEP